MTVFALLNRMLENQSVDLYITEGMPPIWREEKIVERGAAPLTKEDVHSYTHQILDAQSYAELLQNKELNFAYMDGQGNRFRFNFYFQRHHLSIVVRRIKREVPSIEDLNLPDIFKTGVMLKQGLVLVVGSAGVGKSTSVAAMLNHRNENAEGHIITIEDPVEFSHSHKRSIISQREVGIDTMSWDSALKNALRQRPDVVYIGEIRDRNTMQHAMNFAETGHLCIATMHASSASQAVERIANLSSDNDKEQRLFNLANVLKIIIGQRLLPAKLGGMVMALDILRNEGLIKPLIREGNVQELRELMARNADAGMQTFDLSILSLFKQGLVSDETAMLFADQPENIKLEIMKAAMSVSNPSFPGSPLNKDVF